MNMDVKKNQKLVLIEEEVAEEDVEVVVVVVDLPMIEFK